MAVHAPRTWMSHPIDTLKVQTWNEKDARFSTLLEEVQYKVQQLYQYLNKNKFGALGRLLNKRSDAESVVWIQTVCGVLLRRQVIGYSDRDKFDHPDYINLVLRILTCLNKALDDSNGIPKH